MENKKMLLSEDKALFEAILTDLRQLEPYLNRLCTAYQSLGLGNFSNAKFKHLLDIGTGATVAEYNEALERDLEASGVKNTVLRGVVLSGTGAAVTELNGALYQLQRFEPKNYGRRDVKLTTDFISFENDKFIITAADQELILEKYCRFYLESEEQQEFFQMLVKAKEIYLEFKDQDRKLGLNSRLFSFNVFDQFFKAENGSININPKAISAAFDFSRINKRFSK